jgi:hypothetical protein
MKHSLQRHYCRFVFVTCCWAALGSLHAQTPTLNITPPSITNDYVGKIVLTISNITSGQKVIVQKYLDVNGNGIIDGQDSLVQSFGVTDGKVPLIGGVRNISVPGDEDGATNGQVRVELNYPRLNQTLDHIAGHYLFQVVDPNGVFSPIVAPFSIMQKAYPQGVNGQAVAAGTGLPLTNAVVVLVQPNGDNGAGTVADANGNFSISNSPGNFAVVAFRSGCVADQSSAGVGIASNSFAILNLTIQEPFRFCPAT